jgi:caffeoyl-CoA O-methyltransferase
LECCREKLNFPALKPDVGSFISFLFSTNKNLKTVFEFGSGYGHSAFWYFQGKYPPDKVYLTERRLDLLDVYNKIPWPTSYKEKLNYFQGDAFEAFAQTSEVDFILMDGEKGQYLEFLKLAHEKLNQDGLVFIDNSFWRGSFLDEAKIEKHKSAKLVGDLHNYIKSSPHWYSCFLPFLDGVTLLQKK